MPEQNILVPDKEFTTEDNCRWFSYSPEQTGLMMVGMEDLATGVVVTSPLANPQKRTAAHKAWGGARQSRAPGTPWEIYHEMGEKGIDPDQRLDEMFEHYGHRSVGDMARVQVDHHVTPMHLAFAMFQEGYIVSGQEKSTRYQPAFRKAVLHPLSNYLPLDGLNPQLEEAYQKLGQLSLELFAKHRTKLAEAYEEFYQPNAGQRGAFNSRVLDSARYFLLLGQGTGFSYETSARDWSRLISALKASHIGFYRKYATQLETFLAPEAEIETSLAMKAEAPSLIRHTEADPTVNQNLRDLKEFIAGKQDLLVFAKAYGNFPRRQKQSVSLIPNDVSLGERVVMQYIMTLWPGLPADVVYTWLSTRKDEVKTHISKIIFNGHDKYQELPSLAAATNLSLQVVADMGVQRDFNRHRAWGRFMPLPLFYGEAWNRQKAEQVLCKGFGLPLYLAEIDDFKGEADEFGADMVRFYEEAYRFMDQVEREYSKGVDYSLMVNVMPLAQRADFYMHGNPKQALYFTDLRSRAGGHINYRALAFEANKLIAESDPYLSGIVLDKKPDPASREEFFDRS
ncbi:MAG: FAD-dependent thymidylate synthase [Candidatus Daviesbacteria bacterium]|nr:MAG: FAD-dependent thymidylate synthase [Candidatus Daviesbacteria bacterium]